jgi:hypothetical protein
MLAALLVVLRSCALICGGHRAVALENLAVLRQNLICRSPESDRPSRLMLSSVARQDNSCWLHSSSCFELSR